MAMSLRSTLYTSKMHSNDVHTYALFGYLKLCPSTDMSDDYDHILSFFLAQLKKELVNKHKNNIRIVELYNNRCLTTEDGGEMIFQLLRYS